MIAYSVAVRVAVVLVLLCLADAAVARAQEPAPAATPSFEVASIRRNVADTDQTTLRVDPGGRLRVTAAPLRWLIAGAYGDADGGLRPEQVVGFPAALRSERYDIVATAPSGPSAAPATFIAMRPFLRTLLEERFQLKTHR